MSKGMKWFLGIFGGFLLIALLFYIFFPGVPAIIYAKHRFEYFNTKLTPYPFEGYGTPENGKELTAFGISLTVPESTHLHDPDSSSRLYVSDGSESERVAIAFIDQDEPRFEFIGEDGFTQEEFDRGCRGLRRGKPQNNYEMWDLIYNFTPEEYNYHKHGTWRFFINLMNMKETIYPAVGGAGYPFDTENARGFCFYYGKPQGAARNYALLLELYDRENLNRKTTVLLKSEDFDILKEIVNSADIVPQEETE